MVSGQGWYQQTQQKIWVLCFHRLKRKFKILRKYIYPKQQQTNCKDIKTLYKVKITFKRHFGVLFFLYIFLFIYVENRFAKVIKKICKRHTDGMKEK